MKTHEINKFFIKAVDLATQYRGATSPNPPVAAIGIDKDGNELSIKAHEKAGLPHAEVYVIEDCKNKGLLDRLHTLIVTLEPCNHAGKTPPCTKAILNTNIKRVIIGTSDPNPKVNGNGVKTLREAGLEVIENICTSECESLIMPFKKWITTGLPWVTLKSAYSVDGNMIPPSGKKTFSSNESLLFAHKLRKRADAILTGSGTILKDFPEFTVRLVPDHINKIRWLCILDRRQRVPTEYIEQKKAQGFKVLLSKDYIDALRYLGKQDCLEVLVEAGPTLLKWILESNIWDEHYIIKVKENQDVIEHALRYTL
ncbi:MAG: bifunctional diaminohydroxyphosphoribosylaminopyrimidine deaminase/5-amino-6-(5-phosphoribosylamino)uracil reductase RibD [Deltaproteobacteria bacterium]|nr:bifunctional diaminohydroxyphosphoribosylaminopyrimidine deaminase/5-amino-6-(5-phosphoribosylamino)uracil reductase RibD [Deltaproteobacteria bacterium]